MDVTVHELDVLNGQLQELHKATGGPHGSCGIPVISLIIIIIIIYFG